jgi:ribosomal protein S18 acetylase RimI-like enzyme
VSAGVSVTRVTDASGCADVRELAVAHARYERTDAVVPPDWAVRAAGLVAAGRLDLLVARTGGVPVGYASVTTDVETWTAAPYAHLNCLFVADGCRDLGVGRLLVSAVIALVRARGIGTLQWQTPAWNTGAVRFYRRLGAEPQAKQRFTLVLPRGREVPDAVRAVR